MQKGSNWHDPNAAGPSMIGELLYHLHRHVRLVLIAGALMLVLGVVLVGYEALRLLDQPPARPAEAGQALS
ncbi:hypothetical protein [uncultured Brevundimonas sp.]|nr:hypothetical protein [uncultured Brevundimonas sp.]